MEAKIKIDEMENYVEDKEYTANKYVLRCFSITMAVLFLTFVLNLLDVFIIENELMARAFFPSLALYLIVVAFTRKKNMSKPVMKYLLLLAIVLVFSIIGSSITYHVIGASILPILYASLYSSKKVMVYVFVLCVFGTFVQVYVGYYFGLCDANMVLLTAAKMSEYVENGKFTLNEVNNNPALTLGIFYVLPRVLINVVFAAVSHSVYKIVSGTLEKARLTEQLRVLKDEAERANRAKSKFLARMSHEIRTPINAIIGMNEMIIRESDQENVLKYAEDVKESSIILLNIINEILDTSKIESGKMKLVETDYDISSLFNDVYNLINIKAKDKGLKLSFDINNNIPSEYKGDVKLIRQVLVNLLNNAVKYTEEGSVVLKVDAKVTGDKAEIYFAVIDTGIGIKPEDLSKLSEEFQRFDEEKNRNVEGTGLGMNIVKAFLGLMDSELHVESEYGKGSTFSFTIVQPVVNDTPLKDFRERLQNAENKVQERKTIVMPNAKILVVDDYKMNLKVFSNLLKKTQIQITEALSGKECIEYLRKEHFDLVFLDHMMPDMDGVDTLIAINNEKLCPDTPVVMLTANAIAGNREKYLAMGFDDFLSKPIIPDKLDEIVYKFIKPAEKTDEPIETETVMTELVKEPEAEVNIEPEELIGRIRAELPEIDLKVIDSTCAGDKYFYAEIFKDFTELTVKKELVDFYNEKDYNNYCIRVHGFKNNAYTIGAKALGDLAYELEQMTRESIDESILDKHNALLEQYDRICKVYH